jgi:inner membrane protein
LDSLTQVALGAAVGEATLGRQVGNRAILWGAICGTLPDLDVFIPMGSAVKDFTYHRSFSHSMFVMAAVTPLLVWLILKLHPRTAEHRHRWYLLVYLALLTHALLDSATVYGTQIFWPLSSYPVSGSMVFIIDPAYTLPLLLGVLSALIMSRQHPRGHALNTAGLALSSAYLAWCLVAKLQVEELARESLAAQGIDAERVLTTPAPFNSLLWRVLAMGDGGYYEGFRSVFDDGQRIRFERYPSEPELLRDLESHWPVQRLQWFTHGFYSVASKAGDVVITDLRMGLEPDYVFRFKVGELRNPHAVATNSEQLVSERDLSRLGWLWARIWSEEQAIGDSR